MPPLGRACALLVVATLLAGCAAPAPPAGPADAAPPDASPPGDAPPPEDGAATDGTTPPDGAAKEPARGAWAYQAGDVRGTRAAADAAISADTVAGLEMRWSFETEGAVTGTPTVADGRVYAATWKGKVYALDAATGEVVWSADVGTQVDASVTLWGGIAFVGDNKSNLHAFDAATGELRWRARMDEAVHAHLYATPLVVEPEGGEAVLVVPVGSDQESARIHRDHPVDFRGSVAGLDPRTGKERWRTWLVEEGKTGAPVWGSAVADPATGLVYLGTGNAYTEPADDLTDAAVALRVADGAIAWSRQATAGDVFTHKNPSSPDDDFGSTGTLFEADGRTLFAIGQKSSVVWAFDAATGEVAWKHGKTTSGEGVIGDTAFADGVLVVMYSTQNRVAGLDAATGERRWEAETKGPVFSDPAIAGGAVLYGDASGELGALDLATGERLWTAETGGGTVWGGLSVVDGVVYVPVVGTAFLGPKGAVQAWGLPERGA